MDPKFAKLVKNEINKILDKFEGKRGFQRKLQVEIESEIRATLNRLGASSDTPILVNIGEDGFVSVRVGTFPREKSN